MGARCWVMWTMLGREVAVCDTIGQRFDIRYSRFDILFMDPLAIVNSVPNYT